MTCKTLHDAIEKHAPHAHLQSCSESLNRLARNEMDENSFWKIMQFYTEPETMNKILNSAQKQQGEHIIAANTLANLFDSTC